MGNDNMALWDSLKTVDRKFTKPITGKSYKGDSPNPTYVIRKLTEALGPIGGKWGFHVKHERILEGIPHQIVKKQHVELGPPDEDGNQTTLAKTVEYEIVREQYHEVCITFWFDRGEGEPASFDAFGGTPLFYRTRKGTWVMDEDAAKKSLTDAYTKGASWLGACADIFLGLFDDKYSPTPENGSEPQQADTAPARGGRRTTTAPEDDDGWG